MAQKTDITSLAEHLSTISRDYEGVIRLWLDKGYLKAFDPYEQSPALAFLILHNFAYQDEDEYDVAIFHSPEPIMALLMAGISMTGIRDDSDDECPVRVLEESSRQWREGVRIVPNFSEHPYAPYYQIEWDDVNAPVCHDSRLKAVLISDRKRFRKDKNFPDLWSVTYEPNENEAVLGPARCDAPKDFLARMLKKHPYVSRYDIDRLVSEFADRVPSVFFPYFPGEYLPDTSIHLDYNIVSNNSPYFPLHCVQFSLNYGPFVVPERLTSIPKSGDANWDAGLQVITRDFKAEVDTWAFLQDNLKSFEKHEVDGCCRTPIVDNTKDLNPIIEKLDEWNRLLADISARTKVQHFLICPPACSSTLIVEADGTLNLEVTDQRRDTDKPSVVQALFTAMSRKDSNFKAVRKNDTREFIILDVDLEEVSWLTNCEYAHFSELKARFPAIRLRLTLPFDRFAGIFFVLQKFRKKNPRKKVLPKKLSVTLEEFLLLDRETTAIEVRDAVLPPSVKKLNAPDSFIGKLKPFQKEGLGWLSGLEKGGILADEMGLGKTVVGVAHILKHFQKHTAPVLVVCPKSVIRVWADHFNRFAPDLNVVLNILEYHRDKGLHAKSVLITNYHQLLDSAKAQAGKPFDLTPFSAIFIDEAQEIRNPSGKKRKVFSRDRSGPIFMLSGTPIENSITDLWSLIDIIEPGLLGPVSIFEKVTGAKVERQNEMPDAVRTSIKRLVAPYILRRTKDQVNLQLPERIHHIEKFRFSGPAEESYRKLEKSFRRQTAMLLNEMAESPLKYAGNMNRIRRMITQLKQFCAEPTWIDSSLPEQCNPKIARTIDLLESDPRPTLIFSIYNHPLNHLRKFIPSKFKVEALYGRTFDDKCADIVEQFQEGNGPDVLMLQLKAGGVGLTLTHATRAILYDPWWNPSSEDQGLARLHRIGQDKETYSYSFVMDDTIDNRVLQLQSAKEHLIDAFLSDEALQGALTNKLTPGDVWLLLGNNEE